MNTLAETWFLHNLQQPLGERSAIEKLRKQILLDYSQNGSMPKAVRLPEDEFESVLTEVISVGEYPRNTADAVRRGWHNLVVYGVRVTRDNF